MFTAEPPGEDPLLHDPRIIITPHLGTSTTEAQERVALDVAEQIVEIFAGKPARYAVNAPMLAPDTLKVVGPYMAVAETIGSVATQLVTGKLTSIEIDYFGEIADFDVTPLKESGLYDEIVVMCRDAGDRPAAFALPPGTVPGTGLEIAILDPADGGAGYVYLFAQGASRTGWSTSCG